MDLKHILHVVALLTHIQQIECSGSDCTTSDFRWFDFYLSLAHSTTSLHSFLYLFFLPPFTPSFVPFLTFSILPFPTLLSVDMCPWSRELPRKKFNYLEPTILERPYMEATLRRKGPRSSSCSSPQLLRGSSLGTRNVSKAGFNMNYPLTLATATSWETLS